MTIRSVLPFALAFGLATAVVSATDDSITLRMDETVVT